MMEQSPAIIFHKHKNNKRYFLIGIALIALLGFLVVYFSQPDNQAYSITPELIMTPSKPVQVTINKLGINSGTEELGLHPDKTLQIPKKGDRVGWYKSGPAPGEAGPAIMVGHLDWYNGPGVFGNLDQLQPGDVVKVKREDGTVAVFEVRSQESHPQTEFPWDQVYKKTPNPSLRLITCSGEFSQPNSRYSHNLVVYADLIGYE